MKAFSIARRGFLKTAGVAAGGLVIGVALPSIRARGSATVDGRAAAAPNVNAFVQIGADGAVTLVIAKTEMGQGIFTGYAQLLAEELEVDWRTIRVETAPVAAVYNRSDAPIQATGGSDSIVGGFTVMREAGAKARSMLIAAAAKTLVVPESELTAENGTVVHPASGRRLGYGSLSTKAATLQPPKLVKLKAPNEWRLIGKSLPRVDSLEKSDGSAIFGADVRLPGLHYAMVARAPTFGATIASFDGTRAKRIVGVVAVVQVPTGVAVIATNTWAARMGRDALEVYWTPGAAAGFSTSGWANTCAERAGSAGVVARQAGDVTIDVAGAGRRLMADYATPYLAHAPMEPLNCTVALSSDGCDVYTGTQSQTLDRDAAAEVAGLPPDRVRVHTTYLGGAFGRRSNPRCDVVREAVAVAKSFGKPVMTVWSREDDIRGGCYRPQAHSHITATLGLDGLPRTWIHTIATQPISVGTIAEPWFVDQATGLEGLAHEGASDVPYSIPNIRVDVHQQKAPVPVLWQRSVGHYHTAYTVECFIDECAHAAARDPLEYRLSLLKNQPRHVAALKLAAEKSGWGQKLPTHRARGIAVHQMYDTSVVAEVAEVSLIAGKPRVHRVVAAIYCGVAVNPRSVAQQLEGAVIFGLSAALYGEITMEHGRVLQSNYDNYEILRFQEAPIVEAYIVPSIDPPSGVGELGVPPIAPAVANALFALTGVRARRLPLKHTMFPAVRTKNRPSL